MKSYKKQGLSAKSFQLRRSFHQNWAGHNWNTSGSNSNLPRTNTSDSKSTSIFVASLGCSWLQGKPPQEKGKEHAFISHPSTRAFQHTDVLKTGLLWSFTHKCIYPSNFEWLQQEIPVRITAERFHQHDLALFTISSIHIWQTTATHSTKPGPACKAKKKLP